MTSDPKVVVIGLDGATYDILLPLVESGHLPHLAKIIEEGGWGRLESTIPPFTAAAWSTFATGQNPGQHGVLSFRERDRFNYDIKGSGFVDASRFKHTLWEELGENGKKVAVINVPLSYPPRPVNGFMITGMLTPPGASDYTYPDSMKDELGDDYLVDVDFIRKGTEFRRDGFPPKQEMLPKIRHMSDLRAQTSIRLMREQPWDFFMVVFTSTDRVSHFFWDNLIELVKGGGAQDGPIESALLAYFAELDEAIGKLVETAGESAHILLMSDHGFGSSPSKRAYINLWLEQSGLLNKRDSEGLMDLESWRVWVGRHRRLKSILRRFIPEKTQSAVKTASESVSSEIIDWSKTQAYWVPIYFQVCGVEVNLEGEHREGAVSSGHEYEQVRDQVIAASMNLVDPETGIQMVEGAYRREELYSGPYVQGFPDVILVLNPDYIGAGSLAGSLLAEPAPAARPGEHRSDGIFAAFGPTITGKGELTGLRLVDLPATVLYMMDLPIPANYDGRVLTELFSELHLAEHLIRTRDAALKEDSDAEAARTGSSFSSEEQELLEERLRGLGYLE
jgi:predicted AlkP superfamily phosphohydrolase/phosphomutase